MWTLSARSVDTTGGLSLQSTRTFSNTHKKERNIMIIKNNDNNKKKRTERTEKKMFYQEKRFSQPERVNSSHSVQPFQLNLFPPELYSSPSMLRKCRLCRFFTFAILTHRSTWCITISKWENLLRCRVNIWSRQITPVVTFDKP
jgi:hypothetical protein